MIKEYFIINYIFDILHIKINKNYLLFTIKNPISVSKYYYVYLLKYLYNIYPYAINIKMYNKYYKIIILKYLL